MLGPRNRGVRGDRGAAHSVGDRRGTIGARSPAEDRAMLPPVFDFLNGPVRDLVTQVYSAVGYLGVALWVAIESVIIPIPSELVLPFAGFLVGQGTAIEPLTGQPWNVLLPVGCG